VASGYSEQPKKDKALRKRKIVGGILRKPLPRGGAPSLFHSRGRDYGLEFQTRRKRKKNWNRDQNRGRKNEEVPHGLKEIPGTL